MPEQVLDSISHQPKDDQVDCLTYLIQQCNSYVQHVGIVVKKVMCRPRPVLSKQITHKKKKQVNLVVFYFLFAFHARSLSRNLAVNGKSRHVGSISLFHLRSRIYFHRFLCQLNRSVRWDRWDTYVV